MLLARSLERCALRARPLAKRHVNSRWQHVAANSRYFQISEEVLDAIHSRKPVVALESTIYTHGFPYPDNVALASQLESIVRINGGCPATIGILNGVAKVGLTPDEIIELVSPPPAGKKTLKVSRRDFSHVCGAGLNGGTTIAGTMVLAHKAGIKVFATGGLGGVHRGAESSMDISADLTELGRTPVAVISSGAKGFLDIPRTLEYLETEGVSVGTFADGRKGSVEFPSFWSRDSGVQSPVTIKDEKEAAKMIHAHHTLGLTSGLFMANPIPSEHSIPVAKMQAIIEQSIKAADAAGVTGNKNTPFILNKIKELGGGSSIPANRALIESNVKRGTIVAKELLALEKAEVPTEESISVQIPRVISKTSAPKASSRSSSTEMSSSFVEPSKTTAPVLVVGATALDLTATYVPSKSSDSEPALATSNPSIIKPSAGGVAHNIALALHYLGSTPSLLSFSGTDVLAPVLQNLLQISGLPTQGLQRVNGRTPTYLGVNTAERELHLAMADMALLETLSPRIIDGLTSQIAASSAKYVVLDTNMPPSVIRAFLSAAKSANKSTVVEPVSVAKSIRLLPLSAAEATFYPNHFPDMVTPNASELTGLCTAARERGIFDAPRWWEVLNSFALPSSRSNEILRRSISSSLAGNNVGLDPLAVTNELLDQGIPQQSLQLLPLIPTIVTTLGPRGVLLTQLIPENSDRLADSEIAPWMITSGTPGTGAGGVYMRLFPPPERVGAEEVKSVNAVGDTLTAALVKGSVEGKGIERVVMGAQRAAAETLRWEGGVSARLGRLRGVLESGR